MINKNEYIQKEFGVDKKVLELVDRAEERVRESFLRIDEICQINQLKVMKAFSDNKVSDTHFNSTTGYGYDDYGRDTLDKIYAQVLTVRMHWYAIILSQELTQFQLHYLAF